MVIGGLAVSTVMYHYFLLWLRLAAREKRQSQTIDFLYFEQTYTLGFIMYMILHCNTPDLIFFIFHNDDLVSFDNMKTASD